MIENNKSEKIYLTYKTRMTTEARLREKAFLSNAFLAWYSFTLIVFSLMDISSKFLITNFSMISAVVSIAIFAMSLFLYGQRYTERADQFRECYLKLQSLYQSELSMAVKMTKYSEIIALYENQSDRDFDEMVFDCYLRGQVLQNSVGILKISRSILLLVATRRLFRAILVCSIFLIPVLFGILWVRPTA